MNSVVYKNDASVRGVRYSHYDSQGVLTGEAVKATPGALVSLRGHNYSGSTRYIHLFNAAAVPTNGTAPSILPIAVAAGADFSLDIPKDGVWFTTGIAWASSQTRDTLTITGAADVWAFITYH